MAQGVHWFAGRSVMGRERRRRIAIFVLLVAPFLVNGVVNAAVAGTPWLYWSLEVVVWVLVPGTLLYAAQRSAGIDAAHLGLHANIVGRPSPMRILAACVVLAVVWPPCYEALDTLAAAWLPTTPLFAYESVVPTAQPGRLFAALWFALTAGVVEEVIYRGYCWQLCRDLDHPRSWFLVAGPLVFALVHWEAGLASVFVAWVFGVMAAALYLGLRNLWPLIVAHAVTDFIAFS